MVHGTYESRPANGAALPSREAIESWKAAQSRLRNDIDELQSQFDAYGSMIAAAEKLLPTVNGREATQDAASVSENDRPKGSAMLRRGIAKRQDKTWTATVNGIVQRNGRLTYDDLKREIGKTHLAKKLAQTDKSFYGAVGKLAAQEEIVRHRGWLYSADAFARLKKDVAAGRAQDDEAPRNNPAHHSPFGDAIKAFMDGRPKGASSSEIIGELRKTPEFLDTIERHKTHAYNVLSRLVEQGELVKGGGKYFRAPNKSEASV